MSRRKSPKKDWETLREEALRPHRCLGYDHAQVALHLMEREAYPIAERMFRRAIWLNPFESAFSLYLAWCLFKQGRFEEAEQALLAASPSEENREKFREMLDLIRKRRMDRSKRPM